MTIFVNDIEIIVFYGARVIDAVRAYYAEMEMKLPHDDIYIVKDKYGNTMAVDGRLSDDDHIYITTKTKRNESTKT